MAEEEEMLFRQMHDVRFKLTQMSWYLFEMNTVLEKDHVTVFVVY